MANLSGDKLSKHGFIFDYLNFECFISTQKDNKL